MNPAVDFYFNKTSKWQSSIKKLRMILLECRLTEELKWGCPCYLYQKSNIVLIHVFKDYCALLFFKGSLLNDTNGILVQQTKNVQAARQIRFTEDKQVTKLAAVIKAHAYEAIEVEKAGLKMKLKKVEEFNMPEEFEKKLSGTKGKSLKKAFDALTPGRQRGYLLYFSAAKQSQTREARIEKSIPAIMKGKGLND